MHTSFQRFPFFKAFFYIFFFLISWLLQIMRIYVSSIFYDYTHIVIYFLIIRKYYNPIFYDYAHIL